MVIKKTLTRRFLVQFLYNFFYSNSDPKNIFLELENFLVDFSEDFEPISESFSKEILENYQSNHESINKRIANVATEYKFEKLPLIDRAILTVAIVEIAYLKEKTPFKVATDEAIELAKYFKDDSSAGFVNGVLAKIIDEEKLDANG